MRNFQDTFETQKRLFISAFSIRMTIPLNFFKREFENGAEKDLCFCHAQLKITEV